MVELALIKQHCRIDSDDEDALLEQYTAAAEIEVERLSGQLLTRREVSHTFSEFSDWLPLYWGPQPADVTIDYFDANSDPQTISDARIVRGRLYPSDEWPDTDSSEIVVTYTAGWASPPADLVEAVLVLVAGKNDQREGAYDAALRAAEIICGRNRAVTV